MVYGIFLILTNICPAVNVNMAVMDNIPHVQRDCKKLEKYIQKKRAPMRSARAEPAVEKMRDQFVGVVYGMGDGA